MVHKEVCGRFIELCGRVHRVVWQGAQGCVVGL